MTRTQAIEMLREIWGTPHVATARQLDALEPHKLPDETYFACCARLAGIDVFRVAPFDHAAVRRLVCLAEIELAKERGSK
jgi:hypothetical protein